MEEFSYVYGPLWDEFKSLNYSSALIEHHDELRKEVFSYYEICKDHFNVSFKIGRAKLPPGVVAQLEESDFLDSEIGFDVINKEIIHLESLKSTLSTILMLPNSKAEHHLATIFPVRDTSPPTTTQIIIRCTGYKSNLSSSKIEAFLLKRYDNFN